MKLLTYLDERVAKIGAVIDDRVIDLSAVAPDMISLIELGAVGLAQAQALVDSAAGSIPLSSLQLLAPIPNPRRNVMCLGLNYAEHIAEQSSSGEHVGLPEYPIFFTKATTTANGPFDDIVLDPAITQELDWEVELAVVIGRAGSNIDHDEAMAHVFGYMVLNDISARDLQWRHKQYFKGKSLNGACPMGPWIVTTSELGDPGDLKVASRVNGQVKQESSTTRMIFDVPATIMHLSKGMTLLPGDIIATGTPSGVGFARTPPEFLKDGDVVECEVEGIGLIKNRIVAPG